jgi:hypothetical protein
MRWVLFLFLFGLGFSASVVYEAKLQMPKVSNDDVIQYLNYLYERSLAFSDSLEILERMWERSNNVDYVQLEDFRMKKQAYQSALSEFVSAKNAYIDFIKNPRSYSTLQPTTDLQTKLRNLVLRQLELKQSIEVIAPALRALYPDLFYTSQAVNNTRVFNRLVSGFLSSVSQITKLGFNVLFNPLLEFGYVNLVEEQILLVRRLLYFQWKSVNHSGLGVWNTRDARCDYIPPHDCGVWHYTYDPCYICSCDVQIYYVVDNCFHSRVPEGYTGNCSCRRVCKFDVENPATHSKEITLPMPNIPRVHPPNFSPSVPEYDPLPPNFDDLTDNEKGEICRTVSRTLPLRDFSPYLNPFPLPLGDVPYIEVSPDLLPQLDPDTLIQPLPMPFPRRFIVRPSVRPDVEVPPGVDFEFSPDPEIEVVVEISPKELISPINWIITQEIAFAAPLTNTLVDALKDALPTNRDRCKEQEQMLYANFDELRDLIFYSFVGLASIFGFISALLVSVSIFELWKNIPIRRV